MTGDKKPALQLRSLRYGSFSFVITICFIAIVVLFNIVFTALGERYTLRLDLTQDQIFRLSTPSIQFLNQLDTDVKLYVLTSEDYFSTGNLYYIQAHEVIRQYAARSPHITLEYVDLPSNPGFERRFPEYRISTFMIILESGSRTSTVQIQDLFNIEFDQYSATEYISSSKAEQVLTAAIINVTTEQQYVVAILEGLGESGTETLESFLETNNYVIRRQNILVEEIDRDATIAVVSAPMRDYSMDELQKLNRFLQNDGDYGKSLLYLPSILQPATPNLDAFLADWGISVDDGVVFQTDSSRMVTLNNFWSAADYTENVFARPAIDRRLLTIVPEARPMSMLFEARDDIRVFAPLLFTNSAVVMPFDHDEDWTPDTAERRGPMAAFIVSTHLAYSGNLGHVFSHVLVFSSYEVINQTLMTRRTVGNADYILNVFAILSDREDSVYIAPKVIGAQELPITGRDIMMLGAVFIAVLPVSVLLIGGVVFLRRRYL